MDCLRGIPESTVMQSHNSKIAVTLVVVLGGMLGILAGWLSSESSLASFNGTAMPEIRLTGTVTSPSSTLPAQADATPQPAKTVRPEVKVGLPAPDFILADRDNNPIHLSDLRGKVVILNFLASWCQPCRDEMPDLQTLADEYANRGLVVLGINNTYIDDRNDALAFLDELKITFPNVFDEDGDVSVMSYSIYGLPTSIWIDPTGNVQWVKIGPMSPDEMVTTAEQLLNP